MGYKWKISGWVALGVVAGALGTLQIHAIARSTVSQLPLEELQQLAAVYGLIRSDFVESVDDKKLITDAIAGMVSGLDPHSQYFDKKNFKEFREGTTGKFVGVGIEINMEDGLVRIVSPIEGSPAFRAGLKAGDLITKIDDTFVRGLTLEQAVKRMRGEAATKVELNIYRRSEERNFPVTIIREEIRQQTVRGKVVEPGVAWIRVSQFQESTLQDFARKLDEINQKEPKLKGLVLDLRNDPGGLLEGSVGVVSAFVPANTVVVKTHGQIKDAQATFKARPEDYAYGRSDPLKKVPAQFKTVPLVVLVNEGSASASEIVAGALQDHRRATIMGSQTFGKGSVQTIRQLTPETAIKITTARYYTPKGSTIQAKGIVPDIWVDETEEGDVFALLRMREADLDKHLNANKGLDERDTSLDKSREELRKKLRAEAAKRENQNPQPLPEFGSAEDFQLKQALNHLQAKPVIVSKTLSARKDPKTEGDKETPSE